MRDRPIGKRSKKPVLATVLEAQDKAAAKAKVIAAKKPAAKKEK